jgi:hypothetical protein
MVRRNLDGEQELIEGRDFNCASDLNIRDSQKTDVWRKTMNCRRQLLLLALLFPVAAGAQILVDCSGANKQAFPSISAALPSAGPGSTILITGTCNENVFIQGATLLNIGAWFGQTANVNGNITIDHSPFVYVYGLNVTNPNGDGFDVNFSQAVLDTCTSNGNAGNGVNEFGQSTLVLNATGAYNGNGASGVSVGNSWLGINPFTGAVDISNNAGPGILLDNSHGGSVGSTTIFNNGSNGGFGGAGIALVDGSAGGFGTYGGPNTIQGNFGGGLSLSENSRWSFFGPAGGPLNLIQGNGPFGVQAGTGSQVTLYETTVISDHDGPAVDVYANSQAYFFGGNQITRNGTGNDPRSAAVRVDGNSETYIRGGSFTQNYGPALLALVNSSADFTGASFSGNWGGIITCDSSSFEVSDLAPPGLTPPNLHCKTPHALGNRKHIKFGPSKNWDMSSYKAMQAKYKKIATRH